MKSFKYKLKNKHNKLVDRKAILSKLPEGSSIKVYEENDDSKHTQIEILIPKLLAPDNTAGLISLLKKAENEDSLFREKPLTIEERVKILEERMAKLNG